MNLRLVGSEMCLRDRGYTTYIGARLCFLLLNTISAVIMLAAGSSQA